MADSDQEKTEQPTGLKLSEARSKGQVAYTHELAAATMLILGFALIRYSGPHLLETIAKAFVALFRLPVHYYLERPKDMEALGVMLLDVGLAVLPFLAAALIAAVVPGLLQVGFQISTESMSPDLSKLNPFANFGKLFSKDAAIKVLSSTIKIGIVAIVAWNTFGPFIENLADLQGRPVMHTTELVMDLIVLLGFRIGGCLLAFAVLDLFYKRWRHIKNLMMTREDVKEETKRTEGDPKVKSKIKEAQRAIVLKRIRPEVENATLVIRNPTHFAVALKYDNGRDPAPRVVAKGMDEMALRIVQIAIEAGVEVIENKPLARDLYRSVKTGDYIPERLFRAVAQLLAFIFKKKSKRSTAGARGAAASAAGEGR